MDPLSITATCIALVSTITKTSLLVGGFVKDVRAARSDLDGVSRELLSLKTVLELLADDVTDSTNESFPQTLQKQITGIITNCTGVVVDIEETLKKHEGSKLSKAAQWAAFGKNDVVKLRSSLEAHKSALEIALEMVTLTMAREIKADTQELLNDTSAIKEDTAQILAEIARLQEQLPGDAQRNHASGFMLERYLENLTSYAETVFDTLSDNIDERRGRENGSIKRQRSTSQTTRPSSVAGEARITENNHAAPPIAPRSPEDREGKFEAPEEYLIPEQKAADLARETTAQGLLRRFSKRRRRQHDDDNDNEDQSRFLGPSEIATEAESHLKPNDNNANRTGAEAYLAQLKQAALITTNSSGFKGPREMKREGAAREASRDHTRRSRSVSDMSGSDSKIDGHNPLPLHSHSPPTTVTQDFTLTSPPVPLAVDQQKRQVSKAAVAKKPTIAAHIAEANSLRFDPQKQTDDVSQTENVYRRPPREPVGVGNLSPGTNQKQTDGNTPPQLRPATMKAKNRGHAPRKSLFVRRAGTEAPREANHPREGEVDDSDDSYESRSLPKSSTDTRPASHAPRKSFFVRRARMQAPREPNDSREREVDDSKDSYDSYDSRTPPGSSTDTKPASLKGLLSVSTTSSKPVPTICAEILRVLNQLQVDSTEIRGGFRCRHVSPDMEMGLDIPAAEREGSQILEFDVLVVKVPLLSMHGIRFERRSGGTWQYKNMAVQIHRELRI